MARLQFAFVGRLEQEKGFDLVLSALHAFFYMPEPKRPCVHILGRGSLLGELRRTFSASAPLGTFSDFSALSDEECIHRITQWLPAHTLAVFWGWRSSIVVRTILEHTDYALMPSRFLETFGISALEALSAGASVVGFARGGLADFIRPEHAVEEDTPEAFVAKLRTLMQEETNPYARATRARQAALTAARYTQNEWINTLTDSFPPHVRRILLVSDYCSEVGGVETHIRDVLATLRHQGYQVEWFGASLPSSPFLSRMVRALGAAFFSEYNPYMAWKLGRALRDFAPDMVWLHGGTRLLGVSGIRAITQYDAVSYVTHHDLGTFAPLAAEVYSEADIPHEWSRAAWDNVAQGKGKNTWWSRLYLARKFSRLSRLHAVLGQIGTHLVPSQFLAPHVARLLAIPATRVRVLPHPLFEPITK